MSSSIISSGVVLDFVLLRSVMCCFVHTSDECESSSPFLDDEMHETLS